MADEDNEELEGGAGEGSFDADGDEDDEGAGGGGGFDAKKIILFVVLPLLILGGVGGGLYMSGMLDSFLGGSEEEEVAEESAETAKEDRGEAPGGTFVEIPTMIVNLNTEDGTPRYLRLTVQLELGHAEDQAAVEAVIPRVIDQFQTYLRELRVRDLRGSAGIYRLQMELLWRVNQAAAPVEVKDVLFQEILIQ